MGEFIAEHIEVEKAETSPRPVGFLWRGGHHEVVEVLKEWVDIGFGGGMIYGGNCQHFLGEGDDEVVARVKCDYRETIADLHLEAYIQPWVQWCHGKGSLTRNQAHGSPSNLLDTYAASDIPETEIFGPSGLGIPGL